MDGSTAQARRYYHHVANGGTLNERDVARMVEAMEVKDAEITHLRTALAEAEARCAALVAGAYEAAAKACNDCGINEEFNYGLSRSAQNYYRARDAIRALTPADATAALAQKEAKP